MALTRKFLKALNVEDAAIDEIINAHIEPLEPLKADLEKANARIAELEKTAKEYEAHKKTVETDYVPKVDFDKVSKEYADYKTDITAKETKAAINGAVSSYLESKNIKGNNLKLALMALESKMGGFELDGDKNLKDTKTLDDLVTGDFKDLVQTTTKIGADIPHGLDGKADTGIKTISRAAKLAAEYHDNLYGKVENSANTMKGE